MRSYRITILAASLLVLSTVRLAAQEQGVLGQGNVSCHTWLENRSGGDNQVMARIAWVLGYITAFNKYGSKPEGDISGGKGTEQIMVWIDNYCQQYPEHNVYRASVALVDEFRQASGR